MKTNIKLLITILVLSVSGNVFAQRIPLQLEREFLLNAIRLLDSYEYSATLRNNDAAATFHELFDNDSVMLYNDLLGLSTADRIVLPEYIKLMRGNAVSPQVRLKNVRRKDIRDEGRNLVMVLTFDKEMRYNNKCGAILSSKTYYDDKDYAMEMEIIMDKNTKETTIRSLKGSVDSKNPRLDTNFAIVEYKDPRDLNVTNNGSKLRFNAFDQAFIPMPYNLEYYDDDANMKVTSEGTNCNHLTLSYHPKRWSIKPHVNISLGNSFSMDNSSDLMKVNSSNMEFGLDIGYGIPMKGKVKVGIYAGLGYSTGKLSFDVDKLNYNYNAQPGADMDGDTYVRYYEITDLSQQINLGHLIVPLYVDFDFRLHSRFSIFAQLGIKSYFNAGSKVNGFSGKMYAYGVYPKYNDLVINAPWINDFGESEINDNRRSTLDLKGASFDIFFGAGVRAKIYGPLSIEAGVNYQAGLTDVITANNVSGVLAEGHVSESSAFATYTVADGTVFRNLSDYIGNVRRKSLKLNIGLILKF